MNGKAFLLPLARLLMSSLFVWDGIVQLRNPGGTAPSPWASVALKRRALRSNLINRASGFAANESVPLITILISRPERRSRAGTVRTESRFRHRSRLAMV